MRVNIPLLFGQILGLLIVFALALFLPAGTLDWAAGWTFLLWFFAFVTLISAWLLLNNPALLQERMRGAFQAGQKTWDKISQSITGLFFFAWLALMALDAVRFGWSHVPIWLSGVGAVVLLGSFYLFYRTFRENSFLSPVVRTQTDRGQTVISTGPYRLVRHPMYAAFVLFAVGTPLLLGSWYGLAASLVLIVLVARRAVMEEGTLLRELPGYDAYMTRVRYRLIPYIW